MTQALWIAKTGLERAADAHAVISNNLANINTTGFKRDRANFEDLLYQTQRQPGGATSEQTMLPSGMSTGTGVRVATTAKSFTQGNLSQTGNALDVAINGRGFFEVLLPMARRPIPATAPSRSTPRRGGDQRGLIRCSRACRSPRRASITIGSDGTVSVQLAGQAAATQVGQLTVTDFVKPGRPAVQGRQPVHRDRRLRPGHRPARRARTAPAC